MSARSTFVASRLMRAAVTLFVLSAVVFLLSRASGSPVALLLPPEASAEHARQLTEALGLDKPLLVQYAIFLQRAVVGDLGRSLRWNRPVLEVFIERLPATLQLGLAGALITVAVGAPLGVLAAIAPRRLLGRTLRFVSALFQAVPNFVVGVLAVLVLAVQLRVLPAAGRGGLTHMILPLLCLTLYPIGGLLRITMTAMVEVMAQPYIAAARSRGLPESVVVFKHGLSNAVVPVASFMGIMLVNVFLTGSVVIEALFAWPGVGHLVWTAVTTRDFPVVQGGVLLLGTFVIAANLVVDVSYGLFDPRIRL
jgi:peptide/nickel transport system permease protein